ncbi:hypothetical protein FB45DRAFT_949243 [Roridomyces roridus]|uniref:Methyltransferase domain-containing protein n=1 Tax=Roridomyces roridus TaxID=1738132 RepID=A0AAD7F7D1_9AGAR|nr:hypothetical protein FB45DRAFT_949243 [Roridomyces roridus]
MAAMGPRSLSSSSPLVQDSPRLSATSPEPHYRLSRLNPPPRSANLRPPSMISRSMSAGMTFGFTKTPKDKERERELRRERNNTDMHSIRAPSPDGRPSSRFGKLRKKVSLATLISGSSSPQPDELVLSSRSTSSSSSSGTAPPTLSLPDESQPPSPEEEEDSSEPDEDQSATRRRFVKKSAWRTRYKTKLHPYPDVPYPQAYDPVVLQSERATHHLLRRLAPDGSPVFYTSAQPPASVLDLGCGAGIWLLDAARTWRATQFIGFDLVDVAAPALTDGSIPNVRIVRGDFLLCPLPFPDSQFELVRMANLQLAIPQHQWESVLCEVRRVLVPGGRIELIYDDTFFPYGDVPAEELDDEIPSELTPGVSSTTYPLLSPSTPRPPPPTPESSGFFDSSDDEDDGSSSLDTPPETSDDEVVLLPTPDSASERSSFADTASTLVGDASERGSREFKKFEGTPPQLHFEPIHHRPFSGIDHLVIAIPPALEQLATVEVRVDESESEMPLTPVPPRGPPSIISRSSSAPMTPVSATTSNFPFSAPQTPVFDDFNIAPMTKGPWSDKATASVDLERIYTRMLSSKLGVNPRAGEVALPLLERVFGKQRVEDCKTLHLKLAPVGCEEKKGVKLRGIKEVKEERRERKSRVTAEKERDKDKDKRDREKDKERALDTPIPQGLSAKAAERLGIVGGAGAMPPPTIRRRPTLLDSPVESDEEDLLSPGGSDSDHSETSAPPPVPLVRPSLGNTGRGLSTWVPPSEWDAPPEEEERSSLAPSATQKTITPASSSRTIAASRTVTQLSMVFPPAEPQTRTTPTALKHAHTRGGSTSSAVSVKSTASSGKWSATGVFPSRGSEGLVQHPGLLLWPATLIPLAPVELEMHTTKHMQTLLGCKAALGEYIGNFLDPETGERMVSDEEFEDTLWEYECFRRRRFHWPDLPEGRLDAESEAESWDLDMPTPVSARSAFHAIPPRTPALPESSEGDPHPFGRYDLPHVRTFRVFSAVKEAL